MPGHEKIVSTKTAPPRRYANCSPAMVVIGRRAFLNVCFQMTVLSGRPFDLAVMM